MPGGLETLLDIELVSEAIPTETSASCAAAAIPGWNKRPASEKKNYLVTIQRDPSADAPWEFNPMRLVVNDAIDVCVDRNRLVLSRPDGKALPGDNRPCRARCSAEVTARSDAVLSAGRLLSVPR